MDMSADHAPCRCGLTVMAPLALSRMLAFGLTQCKLPQFPPHVAALFRCRNIQPGPLHVRIGLVVIASACC